MNIIIFGPPGGGKGTQSNNIVNDFDLKQISTGNLLRNEIKLQTELGKKVESQIIAGELVSDKIVNILIEKIIFGSKKFNKIIFDGYPRTLQQAQVLDKLLEKFNQKISIVLNLNVDKNIISKRLKGRVTCIKCHKIFNEYFDSPNSKDHHCEKKYLKKRSDDNSKTILNRFDTYVAKTRPVLNYYKKNGTLCEIDGNHKIDEIYNKIKGILMNIRD